MCGRYYLEREQAKPELEEVLERLNRKGVSYKTGEIFPADPAPVIANSRSMIPTPFVMQWGYRLDGKRIINARSETAAAKPMFRDGMQQRRCLVPACHYFEWERDARAKTKYAIRPQIPGQMYMAGLYRVEEAEPVFTILTRDPAQEIRFIHDRMPVILDGDCARAWLDLRVPADEVLQYAVTRVSFEPAVP